MIVSYIIIIIFSSYLWVSLSSMYGKVLVMLMLAFCLTEVMDNKIRPLAFQVRKRNYFQLNNYSSIYYILVFIDVSYFCLLFFSGNFHDVPVCWIYCSHNVYIYFCVIGPMPFIDWKVCLFIFIILFCLHLLSAVCLHFLKVLKGTFDQ